MTATNPHHETVLNALDRLKELTGTLDGWEFANEKEGVKLYSKSVEDCAIPLFRGDTVLEGHQFTAQQVFSVANSPGARKIWDEKFDKSEVKQVYSNCESVFWSKVKTPWPISPRDMSATLLREYGQEAIYIVMTSVEDERIPQVSGNVRANLMISGWKIFKTDAGVGIVYVTQIDLSGSIPTSFLKSIQLQVPLCAGKIIQYIQQHGFPPFIVDGTVPFSFEEFDHPSKTYTIKLDGQGTNKWQVSSLMFPNGVKVEIEGSGDSTIENHDGNIHVTVANMNGPTTVVIKK